jgi:hypothetical protein
MRILIDMATGLMTRLSISKAKLTNEDSKPAFLSDPELKRIISKLEKSYPFEDKLPDITKYGDRYYSIPSSSCYYILFILLLLLLLLLLLPLRQPLRLPLPSLITLTTILLLVISTFTRML